MNEQTPIPAEARQAARRAYHAAHLLGESPVDRAIDSAFAAGLAAGRTAAAADPAVQRVIDAAKVWRVARRDRVSGDVYHNACRALDQAAAALIGELDEEPLPPPTEDELARGRAVVAAAKERSDRWWAARIAENGADHA